MGNGIFKSIGSVMLSSCLTSPPSFKVLAKRPKGKALIDASFSFFGVGSSCAWTARLIIWLNKARFGSTGKASLAKRGETGPTIAVSLAILPRDLPSGVASSGSKISSNAGRIRSNSS